MSEQQTLQTVELELVILAKNHSTYYRIPSICFSPHMCFASTRLFAHSTRTHTQTHTRTRTWRLIYFSTEIVVPATSFVSFLFISPHNCTDLQITTNKLKLLKDTNADTVLPMQPAPQASQHDRRMGANTKSNSCRTQLLLRRCGMVLRSGCVTCTRRCFRRGTYTNLAVPSRHIFLYVRGERAGRGGGVRRNNAFRRIAKCISMLETAMASTPMQTLLITTTEWSRGNKRTHVVRAALSFSDKEHTFRPMNGIQVNIAGNKWDATKWIQDDFIAWAKSIFSVRQPNIFEMHVW